MYNLYKNYSLLDNEELILRTDNPEFSFPSAAEEGRACDNGFSDNPNSILPMLPKAVLSL